MAEIDLQRKEQPSYWWAWLIGAIILALLIAWWVTAANKRQTARNPNPPNTAATPGSPGAAGMRTTAPGAATAALPLAAINANPDNYFGKPISGMATITQVMSPNAFYIEQDSQKLFAYWPNAPMSGNQPAVGKKLSLTGTVRDPKNLQQYVDTTKLGTATLKDLQNAGAFVVVNNGQLQETSNAAGKVGEGLNATGNAVKQGASETGNAAKQGAEKATNAVTPGR